MLLQRCAPSSDTTHDGIGDARRMLAIWIFAAGTHRRCSLGIGPPFNGRACAVTSAMRKSVP
eukprot:2765699-Pyramimonas_sp.AAC.1